MGCVRVGPRPTSWKHRKLGAGVVFDIQQLECRLAYDLHSNICYKCAIIIRGVS